MVIFLVRLFVSILCFRIPIAFALSESALELSQTEDTLRQFMDAAEKGTMTSRVSRSKLERRGDQKLGRQEDSPEERAAPEVLISYVHVPPQKKGALSPVIALFPGYGESWRKYDEVMFDLWQAGFEVFAMDHRGQGDSTHLVKGLHYGLAHVEDFQDYVSDARQWLDQVVLPRAPQGVHILAHSLGGLVALVAVTQGSEIDASSHQNNSLLPKKAKILSIGLNAPLLSLNMSGIPQWLAPWVLNLQIALQGPQSPVIGRRLYDPVTADPRACSVTQSVVRCGRAIALQRRQPQLVVEGPTAQWVSQILKTTNHRDFFADLSKNLGSIPVLVVQAGVDHYVLPKGHGAFCSRYPSCRLEVVPEGYHELLQEKDSIRQGVLEQFINFFKNANQP